MESTRPRFPSLKNQASGVRCSTGPGSALARFVALLMWRGVKGLVKDIMTLEELDDSALVAAMRGGMNRRLDKSRRRRRTFARAAVAQFRWHSHKIMTSSDSAAPEAKFSSNSPSTRSIHICSCSLCMKRGYHIRIILNPESPYIIFFSTP